MSSNRSKSLVRQLVTLAKIRLPVNYQMASSFSWLPALVSAECEDQGTSWKKPGNRPPAPRSLPSLFAVASDVS